MLQYAKMNLSNKHKFDKQSDTTDIGTKIGIYDMGGLLKYERYQKFLYYSRNN